MKGIYYHAHSPQQDFQTDQALLLLLLLDNIDKLDVYYLYT